MLEITTIKEVSALKEGSDIECKLAAGKDGKGELPKEFWPTYSAFANTHGGDILLGIHEQKNCQFAVVGIKDPAGFLFRNPGLMRVPAELALQGGESDCRNRTLHQLFLIYQLVLVQ